MNKQPEITMQTRKNLIDAFWQIYCEKRIEKITIKDITTKAGYNRGTFYEYFTDVYDVLEQIESSVLPNLSKHKDLMTDMNTHLSLEHLVEVFSINKKYYIVLLGKNGDPSFQSKLKTVYKALLRPRLQSLGADDFTLECTLEYAISAFMGVITYYFSLEEDPDINEVIQLLWDLMNDGHKKLVNLIF